MPCCACSRPPASPSDIHLNELPILTALGPASRGVCVVAAGSPSWSSFTASCHQRMALPGVPTRRAGCHSARNAWPWGSLLILVACLCCALLNSGVTAVPTDGGLGSGPHNIPFSLDHFPHNPADLTSSLPSLTLALRSTCDSTSRDWRAA